MCDCQHWWTAAGNRNSRDLLLAFLWHSSLRASNRPSPRYCGFFLPRATLMILDIHIKFSLRMTSETKAEGMAHALRAGPCANQAMPSHSPPARHKATSADGHHSQGSP